MNKIFTFIAACAMSLTAMATDYTGTLNVSVSGSALDPVETTISVTEQADGKYTFSLKNFSMGIDVGTIEVTDIEATTDENGNITLSYDGDVTIQDGDDDSTTWTMAGSSVALTMTSTISGNTLNADLSITVMSFLKVSVSFEGEAAAASSSNSVNYTDSLYITVGGNTLDPVEATITITEQEDGKYTFTLKNFGIASMGMNVGTIEMTDVDGTTGEDGVVTMSTTQTATITDGDDPDVTWSMAGQTVDVTMTATMTEESLYAEITINLYGYLNVYVVFGTSESTGIKAATISNNSGVEAIYDMSGRRLNSLIKGVNIIRKADGTTVKVLQK
ncbi:MAG: calycin-like domain-containing protein [Prevotella sp.]|nr:calycin-like domain-containing protein [Prevotella sp.]